MLASGVEWGVEREYVCVCWRELGGCGLSK